MHYFCQNIAFLRNYYLYNLVFDSNIRNRLDPTILTLGIESIFRFQLLESIRSNLNRVLDSNSITRSDAISLYNSNYNCLLFNYFFAIVLFYNNLFFDNLLFKITNNNNNYNRNNFKIVL